MKLRGLKNLSQPANGIHVAFKWRCYVYTNSKTQDFRGVFYH